MANPAFIPVDAESGRTAVQPGLDMLVAVLAARQAQSPTAQQIRAETQTSLSTIERLETVRALLAGSVDRSLSHGRFWAAPSDAVSTESEIRP